MVEQRGTRADMTSNTQYLYTFYNVNQYVTYWYIDPMSVC